MTASSATRTLARPGLRPPVRRHRPAYLSYLPHLVGRDNGAEGNAKLSAVRSVTSISGPAAAGPLIGLVGVPATLVASSVGMALSGVFGHHYPQARTEASTQPKSQSAARDQERTEVRTPAPRLARRHTRRRSLQPLPGHVPGHAARLPRA